MKRLLVCLLVAFSFMNVAYAAKEKEVKVSNKLIFTCDNNKIKLNDQAVCRVSIDSSHNYDKLSFDINFTDSVELVATRSNYDTMWTFIEEKNHFTATSIESHYGLQEFGILLLKGVKDGVHNIEIKNITLIDDEKERTSDDVSYELKVISEDNYLSSIKINDKELSEFEENTLSYNININDEDKITVEGISRNEFAKVTGNGSYDLSSKIGEFVIPVNVVSENGNTRIYTLYVKRNDFKSDGIDKTLSNLSIKDDKGNTLIIDFKKDNYIYNINLNDNVKSLTVNGTLSNDNTSFVKSYEGGVIKLVSGNNVIILKVKDENGEVLNYVINATKAVASLSSDSYLSNLSVDGYDIKFSKKVKKYVLEVKANTKELTINATPNDKNAVVKISGNKDIKDGSVVKIAVTAANQTTTNYQISIKLLKPNYLKFFISFVLGIGLLYFVFNTYKKFKNRPKRRKIVKTTRSTVKKKVTSTKTVKKNTNAKMEIRKSPTKKKNISKKRAPKKNGVNKKKNK